MTNRNPGLPITAVTVPGLGKIESKDLMNRLQAREYTGKSEGTSDRWRKHGFLNFITFEEFGVQVFYTKGLLDEAQRELDPEYDGEIVIEDREKLVIEEGMNHDG